MSETEEKSFETLIEQLDGIVQKLERGELSLEESLSAYEQGVRLVRGAQKKLDDMDQRLSELTQNGQLKPLATPDEGDDA